MSEHRAEPPFLQVVVCRGREGARPDEVERVAVALQRWVERQPGFVRRKLVHDGAGAWADVVEWRDRASAEAAAAAPDHPPMEAIARVLAVETMTFVQGAAVELAP